MGVVIGVWPSRVEVVWIMLRRWDGVVLLVVVWLYRLLCVEVLAGGGSWMSVGVGSCVGRWVG
jgi:hypothetical protein